MNYTTVLMGLLRSLGHENARQVLDQLEMHLGLVPSTHLRLSVTVQHLETLGFRLENSDLFGEAARVYQIISGLCPNNRSHWELLALTALLRDFASRKCWDDARRTLGNFKQSKRDSITIKPLTDLIIEIGWKYECQQSLEAAIHCYSIAFYLNDGDADVLTNDGQIISTKIRNLQISQMKILAEQGRHEEAIELNEKIRMITSLERISIYRIVSSKQASLLGKCIYREIIPSREIDEPNVKFLDGNLSLISEAGSLQGAPQYVAHFDNCLTFPRSNIVLRDDLLIYDLAAHPRSDVAEIKDGDNPDQIMRAIFGAGRALVEMPEVTQTMDAGLMMFGFQSKNYGHWLLEFVPRMLWFNNPICPSSIPICIDDGMPDNHHQIIELIDERSRPVIKLSAVPTHFRELWVGSVPAFFPFDMRPGRQFYDTIWPKDVLYYMRCKILNRISERKQIPQKTSRRIFLTRKGYSQRQLVNECEIADFLSNLGFDIIQPERLDFIEQVYLFQSAELIVGTASSALTNCIFCRPDAKIIAFIHEDLSFNFRGYTSMIESSGARLIFVRGKTVDKDNLHPFHVNFIVDKAQILKALQIQND